MSYADMNHPGGAAAAAPSGKGPVVTPPGQLKGPRADRFLVVGNFGLNLGAVSYIEGLTNVEGDLSVVMSNGSQLDFSGEDAVTIRTYLLAHGTKPDDASE
jgi:hypothetical protein